jgi:hypothetical protein
MKRLGLATPKFVILDSWKYLRREKERNENEKRKKGKFKCERKFKDHLKKGEGEYRMNS